MAIPSCTSVCPTCTRLRAATLAIVGRDGLDAITLARLADAASVSPEQVRDHYASSEACLLDTYEAVAREIYEDFEAAFLCEPGWRAALTAGGRRLLARLAARPAEARLCFVEVLKGDHELLRRRMRSRRRLVALFVRELQRRRPAPDEPLPELALELLIGAGFQAIAASVSAGATDTLPALEPELVARARVFGTAS